VALSVSAVASQVGERATNDAQKAPADVVPLCLKDLIMVLPLALSKFGLVVFFSSEAPLVLDCLMNLLSVLPLTLDKASW
jgi:hypothetical protein